MSKSILRLDDASEYMDLVKWKQMEDLLNKYNIKPIFGIIPQNRDKSLIGRYVYPRAFIALTNIIKKMIIVA